MKSYSFCYCIFLLIHCISLYSQQHHLHPAFTSELTFDNNRAYLNGRPFTGMHVDEQSYKQLGEYRHGYRQGMHVELWSNGHTKSTGEYSNGVKVGKHIIWYESGKKESENTYQYGKLHGNSFRWHSNGTLHIEAQYNQGNLVGKYTEHNSKGNKLFMASFINGRVDGEVIRWYENGKIKSQGVFQGDRKFDRYTEYFENGNKFIEQQYNNVGILNGISNEWYSNGNVKFMHSYINGKVADGKYTVYDSIGQNLLEETYKNGIKINEARYIDGDLYEDINLYYPNSKILQSAGRTKNSVRHGSWSECHANGQLSLEGEYVDGKKHGVFTFWYDNGDVKLRGTYSNNELIEVHYENKINPDHSVNRLYTENYLLFRCVAGTIRPIDTFFVMTNFRMDRTDTNNKLASQIIHALQHRFDLIPKNDIKLYGNKLLPFHFEFSNIRYSTVYDDGKSSLSIGGVVALHTQGRPGYRGQSSFHVKITDILNKRTVLNTMITAQTEIYPTRNEAYNNAYRVNLQAFTSSVYEVFQVKAKISAITERDRRNNARAVLIDVGQNLGLAKGFWFRVYKEEDPNTPIGKITVDQVSSFNAICKISEGEKHITEYIDSGKSLIVISPSNFSSK